MSSYIKIYNCTFTIIHPKNHTSNKVGNLVQLRGLRLRSTWVGEKKIIG